MPDDRLYGYAHLLTERMLLVHAPAMSEIIGSEPGAETLASLPLIAYDEELPLIRALWASMFQRAPEMQATFTIPIYVLSATWSVTATGGQCCRIITVTMT
ncbi:hypothetical protein ECZC06_56030 [Escherichia coli]|nr:hypothetical protein ECZC06_56030 [Escherichia coli]